ncbi:hypothetical protein AGDE_14507 [Angomonas deanei]|uniref:Uncharacterized protein n=1 Tax=Angomonas deanei TaxID=59799 RepID=A0A7G2CLW1_9TRYP|nr:hypothetical protein AGDE_14507 [Angomonas deanei]CAD2220415.1 hypothetical protein, conserved [Angomonas deanei]|eukprot:EPY20733.1 hypothetical protein AGDE_14507 [Angomonas deanei]
MSEIRFEEDLKELKEFKNAIATCTKRTASLSQAAQQFVKLLKESQESMAELATHTKYGGEELPECVFSDADLTDLVRSVDKLVSKQLQSLNTVTLTAYNNGKKRRESREKYLKATGGKQIFAANQAKIDKLKEEFSVDSDNYSASRAAYVDYKDPNVKLITVDFNLGYHTILSSLFKGVNPPSAYPDQNYQARTTPERLVGTETNAPGYYGNADPPQKPDSPVATRNTGPAQRRLSMRSAEIVNGVPVERGDSGPHYEYDVLPNGQNRPANPPRRSSGRLERHYNSVGGDSSAASLLDADMYDF